MPIRKSTGKILIVDDDPDIRVYIASLLTIHGYAIVEADNQEEGYRQAREIRPALIILDALISFGTPINLYRELKQDHRLRKIAVIMLATIPRRTFLHYRTVQGGAPGKTIPEPEAFLEKPPEAEELLYWVKLLIDGRHKESHSGVEVNIGHRPFTK